MFGLLYFSCSCLSDDASSLSCPHTQWRHCLYLPAFLNPCFQRITSLPLSQLDILPAFSLNLPLRLLTHISVRTTFVMSIFHLWTLVTKEKADLLVFIGSCTRHIYLIGFVVLVFLFFPWSFSPVCPEMDLIHACWWDFHDCWWLSCSYCGESLKFKMMGYLYHQNWQRLEISSDNPKSNCCYLLVHPSAPFLPHSTLICPGFSTVPILTGLMYSFSISPPSLPDTSSHVPSHCL